MTSPKYPTKFELEEIFEFRNCELWRKEFMRSNGRKWPRKLVKNVANHDKGYCVVQFKDRMVRYHTISYILHNGDIPEGYIIDHIDGNRINNHPTNLRLVTSRGNCHNRKKHREGRLPGCHFLKKEGRWWSRVEVRGKRVSLGLYSTEQEAHAAYTKYCETHQLT